MLKDSFTRIRYILQEICRILVFVPCFKSFYHFGFLASFQRVPFRRDVDQTYRRKVNVKTHLLSSVDLFALVYLNTLNEPIYNSGSQLCDLGTLTDRFKETRRSTLSCSIVVKACSALAVYSTN